jgi:predicted ribosomally synthesized peptide with SipW-like signal peptide
MAVALAIGLVGGAFAYFDSSATSSTNTFSSGTVVVTIDDSGYTSVPIASIGNMFPGDITPWMSMKVKVVGSLPEVATYSRFTISDGDNDGLSKVLNFYDYQVLYFYPDGTKNVRYGVAGTDNYFGTERNEDYFIKEGDASTSSPQSWTGIGGDINLNDWIYDGFGPGDNRGAWDGEGLIKDSYYVVNFRLQMDPAAGNAYQGKSVTVGFEAKATQNVAAAILALGITNIPNLATAQLDVDYFDIQLPGGAPTDQW